MAQSKFFFALVPDQMLIKQLHQFALSLKQQGRQKVTHPEKIHITLRYIGEVTDSVRQCLLEKATGLKADCFQIQLDQIGFWKRPQIVWCGPRECSNEFAALVEQLENICQQCGIAAETRSYVPHITLLRKANRSVSASLPAFPVWNIKEFVLLESITTASTTEYRLIKSWPLS